MIVQQERRLRLWGFLVGLFGRLAVDKEDKVWRKVAAPMYGVKQKRVQMLKKR